MEVLIERLNKKGNKINRTCTICKINYPKTKEYFTTFISKRDGEVWVSHCRTCERIHIQKRNSNPARYIKSLINGINKDIRRQKKGFNLDFEYVYNLFLTQERKCALTGIEMTTLKGKGLLFSNVSIDRINPNIGYFNDNIQLVCFWANQSKGILSTEEFKNMINITYKHLNNEG